LKAGDFVWPKKPHAFIPYSSGSARSVEADQTSWLQERDRYVATLSGESNLNAADRKRLELLRNMSFREFLAIYEGNQIPGVPGAYSGSGFYVGHVGIIDMDAAGNPSVIEAVLDSGVRSVTYDDWLAHRPGEMVWLGRLRNLAPESRASVPTEAKHYLGKPYNFWNFDLNDDSGFYCSKLAWLSVSRSLHFAVDGNSDPKRALWFSPKQFLYCPTIERIFDPGPYAYE
jgi:hypothetical protein